MDKHRQIAFITAFIIAILVMMLGKACTDSMFNNQSEIIQNVSQTTQDYKNYSDNSDNKISYTETSIQTNTPIEYVTNMFGEVIGTRETTVADVQETDIQTTTKERSILEQYNENKTDSIKNQDGYKQKSEISITIH